MENEMINKIKTTLKQGLSGPITTFENIVSINEMDNGANEEQIKAVIEHYKLPEDYLSFLKSFNGGILFKIDDIAGFHLFGCDSIKEENEIQMNNYESDWDSNIILFCASIGDDDYLGFKIIDEKNYQILDCNLYESPSNWNVIGNSFPNFISKLIDEKGRKFWLF